MRTHQMVNLDYYFWANPSKRTNFRLQLHREAKRHLQVITIASLFLDKWHARLIPWPRGTRVVKSDGWRGVWATTFKQIGSLFAGSTIDGNRMICLTKYVTVRVSKGEPNLYDGFWLARVSAVYRLPLCGHVCVYTHVHARALYEPASLYTQAHRCFLDVASIAKLKFQHQQ